MSRKHQICFVIADGGHVRFVQPAADNALHTTEALDSVTLHKRDHDLVSDRPGRSFESNTPGRHAYAPRHDPHEQEKLRFAHLVAERVNQDCTAGLFNELVVVAPSHVLTELTDALDARTKTKVLGTLAKDLVKVPDHELLPHLKEWARPVHRA